MMAQTTSTPARRRRAALTAAVASLLAACGRIGPLEPPPDANAPPKPAQTSQDATLSPQLKPKIPPIVPPKQSFFLDPLLK